METKTESLNTSDGFTSETPTFFSSVDEASHRFMYSDVIIGCLATLVIVIGIVGNAATILAFILDRQLRTVYNIYIINLAFTDLAICTLTMPIYAIYSVSDSWKFGRVICKVYILTDFSFCMESAFTICLLSLNRFLLLKHGVNYHIRETAKVALKKIAASWIVVLLFYSPVCLGWEYFDKGFVFIPGECTADFEHNFLFNILLSILEFFAPLITISTLNVAIYVKIRKHKLKKAVRTRQKVTTVSQRCHDEFHKVKRGQSLTAVSMKTKDNQTAGERENSKAGRILVFLVVVFIICWGPYTVQALIISVSSDSYQYHVYEFFIWLLWLKSVANPFLYALVSSRFRQNIKRILYCNLHHHQVRPQL